MAIFLGNFLEKLVFELDVLGLPRRAKGWEILYNMYKMNTGMKGGSKRNLLKKKVRRQIVTELKYKVEKFQC